MKETIENLKKEKAQIELMSSLFDRIGLEHGSPDQTRAMAFESIFEQAISNIDAAIRQLSILEKQLY